MLSVTKASEPRSPLRVTRADLTLLLNLARKVPHFATSSHLTVYMIIENSAMKADTVPEPCSRLSNSISAMALGFRSLKAFLRDVTKVV